MYTVYPHVYVYFYIIVTRHQYILYYVCPWSPFIVSLPYANLYSSCSWTNFVHVPNTHTRYVRVVHAHIRKHTRHTCTHTHNTVLMHTLTQTRLHIHTHVHMQWISVVLSWACSGWPTLQRSTQQPLGSTLSGWSFTSQSLSVATSQREHWSSCHRSALHREVWEIENTVKLSPHQIFIVSTFPSEV